MSEARRFYLDPAEAESRELIAVSAGCEHCNPDYIISRKSFPFLSFEYVARGKGSVLLNNRFYDLMPGTIFSYGPGIPQLIRTDPDDPMVKYFVDFTGSKALNLMKQAGISPGMIIQISKPAEFTETLDRLIKEGISSSSLRSQICSSLLKYLLFKTADIRIPFGSIETRAFYSYQKCLQYINENYLALFTVEQVAQDCFLDKTYLCRLFKRFDRQSPYQHLVRLKMNKAAELLEEPGKLVKQVADELNYSDPYHFSKVFKRLHGIPPEEFICRMVNRPIAVKTIKHPKGKI